MSIRDWPVAERPREKLLQRGAMALSDAELLAIFLRTGVSGKSAVDLARHLLGQFGSLRTLLEARQAVFIQHLAPMASVLIPFFWTQFRAPECSRPSGSAVCSILCPFAAALPGAGAAACGI